MDKTNRKGSRWLSLLGASSGLVMLMGGLFGAGLGCEGSSSGVCVARCDCEGCSQKERENCADDVDDSARLADHDDCGDAFSAYVDCYENEGTCADGVWMSAACASQSSAFRACSLRAARWVRSPCTEAALKITSCGIPSGNPSSCDSVSECAAFCALRASCQELLESMPGSAYVGCVVECNSNAGP